MKQSEKIAFSVSIILVLMIIVGIYFIQRDAIDLSSYDIELSNPDELDTENYALDAYDAIRIALRQVKDEQIVCIEAFPVEEIVLDDTLKGEFWIVHIYHDPRGLPHGSFTALSIDQKGTILDITDVEWAVGG